MGRVYTQQLPSGARAASTYVDLDGVQVRITLITVDEDHVRAEVSFRRGRWDTWTKPVLVGEDLPL